jgi:AcrR family transcriptional regulator
MTKKDKLTRNKILTTTGWLFSQRGYFGVSMQDIAEEVGITKSALYYHFASKDTLAEILLRDAVNQLKKELKKAKNGSRLPADALFNLTKTFLDFKIKHPEITLLHSLGLSSDEKLPLVQLVVDLRTELIKFLRDLIEGIDFARKMTYRTIFTLTTTLMSFVLHPFQYNSQSPKQLASDLTALLLPKTNRHTK